MKVFTNVAFEGHYPVGTAAVVIANDKHDAARVLRSALSNAGLSTGVDAGDMIEVNTENEHAVILCDVDF